MSYLEKIRRKSRKLLAGNGVVYGIARKRAVQGAGGALPDSIAAREILEAASPRPAHCELPVKRSWPDTPEVEGTFIVPCYNVGKFLEECLDSVLGQVTERSYEVIAVDDGSTDGTGEILDRYAARDSRLRVVHQANRGLSGARNAGIELARGSCFSLIPTTS